MAVASMTLAEFRVGGVLGRSMAILARNFGPFGLLALMFTAPAVLATALIDAEGVLIDPKAIQALQYGNAAAIQQILSTVAVMVGLILFGFVLSMMATAAMVYGTFQDLRGRPATFGTSLRNGLGVVFPVLGVSLLYALLLSLCGIPFVIGSSIGNVFMVVLGAIAMVVLMFRAMATFWVAVPAAVVERPGVVASLKRSASLTKGHRWRVFGIVVVITVAMLVASGIVQAPFAAGIVNAGPDMLTSGPFIAANILGLLVNAFFTALSAVATAVAYHDLRAVKEGFDIDQFASVFD